MTHQKSKKKKKAYHKPSLVKFGDLRRITGQTFTKGGINQDGCGGLENPKSRIVGGGKQ